MGTSPVPDNPLICRCLLPYTTYLTTIASVTISRCHTLGLRGRIILLGQAAPDIQESVSTACLMAQTNVLRDGSPILDSIAN
jgi:hypothetical protein